MEIALFARAWLVFTVWCLAVFTTVEHLCPRRRARPRWRAIAIGIALLGVDAAMTRWLTVASTSAALARTCAFAATLTVLDRLFGSWSR